MAYVHCHNCDWSQDDFWDFRFWRRHSYNPISYFLRRVIGWKDGLWRPRRTRHDHWYAVEQKWKRDDPHSWYLVWWLLKRMCRSFKHQHWWTWTGYWTDKRKVCPSCGSPKLDVD
jgi:hypothetical protein